jgi:DNA adenine methylase
MKKLNKVLISFMAWVVVSALLVQNIAAAYEIDALVHDSGAAIAELGAVFRRAPDCQESWRAFQKIQSNGLTFEPAGLNEIDSAIQSYNKYLGRSQYGQKPFTRDEIAALIKKKAVYLLKTRNGIKGILFTGFANTDGDINKIRNYPLWTEMVYSEKLIEKPDTIFFWAILTEEGSGLGHKFIQMAKEYFKDIPNLATFSPVVLPAYSQFAENLRRYNIPEGIIQEYGIYLYLSSLREGDFRLYLKYILNEHFMMPEEFFSLLKKEGRNPKFLDVVQNFHSGMNGAVIVDVLPYREGFTRPDSLYTVIYGYKGWEGKNTIGFSELGNVFSELLSDAAWIYTANGEKAPYWDQEKLEIRAHEYLQKAGKQGRIRRIWGHGNKKGKTRDDNYRVLKFISICCKEAGLTEEVSVALVETDEGEDDSAGLAEIKDEKGNIKAVLTALGGRFAYEGSEDLVVKGLIPYTIYLRADDVFVYKGLGEEGRLAFIAKLRHESKDAERKKRGEIQTYFDEEKNISRRINKQEEKVLRIKKLLGNRLIRYLLHTDDYFSDYELVLEFLRTADFPENLKERSLWLILREAEKYVREKLGTEIKEVIKLNFGRDKRFTKLILENIKTARDGPLFKDTAVRNTYLLLLAAAVLNEDNSFMKELRDAVVAAGDTFSERELIIVSDSAGDSDSSIEKGIDTFLIWLGNKRKLMPVLKRYFPKRFNGYYEPFLGSGAVYLDTQPKKAFLNDTSHELINMYRALRDEPEKVIAYLEKYLRGYFFNNEGKPTTMDEKEDYYLCVRALCPTGRRELKKYDLLKDRFLPMPITSAQQAARMIFLNAACVGGISRFNNEGDFNVPFGRRNALSIAKTPLEIYSRPNESLCRSEALLEVSSALQNACIFAMDYEEVLGKAKAGDFIYLDPPYHFADGNGFTEYSRQFNELEQWRLAQVFRELHRKGCYVMLSNHNTAFIHNLYAGFSIKTFSIKRNIARVSKGEKKVEEVIIRNFVNNEEEGKSKTEKGSMQAVQLPALRKEVEDMLERLSPDPVSLEVSL